MFATEPIFDDAFFVFGDGVDFVLLTATKHKCEQKFELHSLFCDFSFVKEWAIQLICPLERC